MAIGAILPAAGAGRRFGAADGRSKVEQDLGGRPVFQRAVEPFLEHGEVEAIVLAVAPAAREPFRERWGPHLAFHGVELIAGGESGRAETVARALAALPEPCDKVVVHDAARPLVPAAVVERVIAALAHAPAVVPGVPVSGTLKRVAAGQARASPSGGGAGLDDLLGPETPGAAPERFVRETVDREGVHEIQTPQGFDRALLERAYERVEAQGLSVTDDAGAVEALGETVALVDGARRNLKITEPEDLELARAWYR